MTQATRVHSTPPTNTSAINPSGPVDPTRRHFLTVAAGGAVAAAIPYGKKIETAQRRQRSNIFDLGPVLHNKLAVDA
jgi:hypothetical protein